MFAFLSLLIVAGLLGFLISRYRNIRTRDRDRFNRRLEHLETAIANLTFNLDRDSDRWQRDRRELDAIVQGLLEHRQELNSRTIELNGDVLKLISGEIQIRGELSRLSAKLTQLQREIETISIQMEQLSRAKAGIEAIQTQCDRGWDLVTIDSQVDPQDANRGWLLLGFRK